MTHRSKSTLFLIEQLIVIAVFAICAVACISIFTAAYFNASDSMATRYAILKAESGAEAFKAIGGDINAMADIMGGTSGQGEPGTAVVTVYYDSMWKEISSEADASYILLLVVNAPHNPNDTALITGELTIGKITGEELITLSLAARGS
jgi:hypothetical protein